MMISHARRSVGVVIERRASVRKNARMIATHSWRKYTSRPIALPTCSITTNASQKDSGRDCALTSAFQPNSVGNSTVCPRLEIGNSSVTPCSSPSTTAWK